MTDHGCLRIDRSARQRALRRIGGWPTAVMLAAGTGNGLCRTCR